MKTINKKVILTGANGYLGRFYRNELLKRDYYVIGVDLGSSLESNSKDDRDKNYEFHSVDFTDISMVEGFANTICTKYPNIHGLINNAAYNQKIRTNSGASTLEDFPIKEWESTLLVNLTAPMVLSRIVGKSMSSSGSGSIINIASVYGFIAPDQRIYGNSGQNSNVAYGVTKAGLIQLTKYLASYYQGYNVRVNCISPGGIENNQSDGFIDRYAFKTMLHRMGKPEDVFGAIKYLLSDDSLWTTGANLIIDGGFSSW